MSLDNSTGSSTIRLDEGHHVGDGGLPERFVNPGLPPHVHRMADESEKAAKRAAREADDA